MATPKAIRLSSVPENPTTLPTIFTERASCVPSTGAKPGSRIPHLHGARRSTRERAARSSARSQFNRSPQATKIQSCSPRFRERTFPPADRCPREFGARPTAAIIGFEFSLTAAGRQAHHSIRGQTSFLIRAILPATPFMPHSEIPKGDSDPQPSCPVAPCNGVYRSMDAGVTWSRVTGLDSASNPAAYGRISLAIAPGASPSSSTLFVAIADATNAQNPSGRLLDVFKGTGIAANGTGGAWTNILSASNLPDFCAPQCFYDMAIAVAPASSGSVIFVGGSAQPGIRGKVLDFSLH